MVAPSREPLNVQGHPRVIPARRRSSLRFGVRQAGPPEVIVHGRIVNDWQDPRPGLPKPFTFALALCVPPLPPSGTPGRSENSPEGKAQGLIQVS